jgi:hypothetical protein
MGVDDAGPKHSKKVLHVRVPLAGQRVTARSHPGCSLCTCSLLHHQQSLMSGYACALASHIPNSLPQQWRLAATLQQQRYVPADSHALHTSS